MVVLLNMLKEMFGYITEYGVQHYVIKFVSDLREVGGLFSPGPPVSSTDKTDRHDITEILLKVVLKKQNRKKPPLFNSSKFGTLILIKKSFL